MTQKQALQELLDKVEAGNRAFTLKGTPFQGLGETVIFAYYGSLDAARALHNAVLTDWHWNLGEGARCYIQSPDFKSITWESGDKITTNVLAGSSFTSNNKCPARAWLIAIINALIAETEE